MVVMALSILIPDVNGIDLIANAELFQIIVALIRQNGDTDAVRAGE
jgi:hypothetical protein